MTVYSNNVHRRPYLVVAAGVVFTAFSAIFVRLSDAPPFIIAAYRMWFATMGVALLSAGDLIIRRKVKKPQAGLQAERRPPVVLLSVLSGVFLSLHFATWISSLQYTSVASSTVLVTTHPIIVSVAGYLLLREHLSRRSVVFMVAALGGGLILVVGGFGEGGSAPLGNLLAFLGAVAVSGYMILGRVVRRHLSNNRYTLIVYGVSAALLTIYAVVVRNRLFGYSGREIVIFLLLAVVCTLLGHSLFNWALRFVSPTAISTSILGEPVIAGVLAIVIFQEVPTVYTVVGGLVILASIFFFLRESGKTRVK